MRLASPAPPRPGSRSGLLLALSCLTWAVLAASVASGGDPAPRVLQAEGSVEIGRGEPPVWRPAREGVPIQVGDRIRTGHGGRAELALGAGTARLFGNSMLRISEDALSPRGYERIELDKGRSLFDVVKRRRGERFEVRTPEVVVSVKGTRFGVDADPAHNGVSVQHGTVGVRGLDAAAAESEMLVRAGFAAVSGPDGSLQLMVAPEVDSWQGWSRGIAPARLAPRRAAAANAPLAAAREAGALAGQQALTEFKESAAAEPRRGPQPGADVKRPAPAKAAFDSRTELAAPRSREALGLDVVGRDQLSGVTVDKTVDMLEGRNPGSANLIGSLDMDIRLHDDRLIVALPDGHEEDISASELSTVIATGDDNPLGQPLLDALAAQGADSSDFANELQSLLGTLSK